MTQITHIRCDRCGKNTARDNRSLRREQGWANCLVNIDNFDFCPNCWKEMLALADVDEPAENLP